MPNYISQFNNLAINQKGFTDSDIKLWLPIDKKIECDCEKALSVIKKSLKTTGIPPKKMVGKCFAMITGASNALLQEQIKHTVTIGNIMVDGKPYFNTSPETIEKDMLAGFEPNEILHSHAWITLEDGTIIDITILSSLRKKENKKPLKLNQAIYNSKTTYQNKIQYIPYHLGPEYIFRTSTPPDDFYLNLQFKWFKSLDTVLNS